MRRRSSAFIRGHFFLLLVLVACSGNDHPPVPPRITFQETVFNAGRVQQGAEIHHTFYFRNDGDLDLHIDQVRSSCGCMSAAPPQEVISPGDTGQIDVTFNTTSYYGNVARTTAVLSNDPASPVTGLRITADIDFDIAVDPPEIYVGAVERGATARVYPRVLVGDGSKVELERITSKGKVVAAEWSGSAADSRERRFQVTIRRDAPVGAFRESVLIHTNGGKRPVVAVPIVGTVREATERLLSNQG